MYRRAALAMTEIPSLRAQRGNPSHLGSPRFARDDETAHFQSERGFTLIELLVVLAIAGLLIALVPVAYNKAKDSAQYSTALRTIISDLRQARQKATEQGFQAEFFVDLVQRTYGITGSNPHTLPETLQIKATVGSDQLQQGRVASIIFLPDGGATGGSFEITRPSGSGVRLRVDWLSGQITQDKLQQ